ncbi:hypothetical protein ACGFZB_06310 [Streptomyces cinerochromogenes]|uniref:LysR substrate-binding domain-containing protein n=1 Tax=Streptomyces cinerochromogenes TaxID=66422 RepID=A0ABW7AYT7_9ACTN
MDLVFQPGTGTGSRSCRGWRLAVARELEEGELVALRLAGSLRPVSIVAQWHPRLGLAESSLRALLDLARRADPLAGMPHRLPPGSP